MQNSSQHSFYSTLQTQYGSLCHAFAVQAGKQAKTYSMVSTRKGSNDSIDTRSKFKTQICKYWMLKIACPFEDLCSFAHGQEEMRTKQMLPSRYKTRICTKFNREGYCPYGARCQFIHNASIKRQKYENIIQKIRNGYLEFMEQINYQFSKRQQRLPVFENIGSTTKEDAKMHGLNIIGEYEIKEEKLGLIIHNKIRHNSI